jgi:hypothetical protein
MLWGVAQIAKESLDLQWITPTGKKACLLTQVLAPLYKDQNHYRAFSFKSIKNLMGLSATYFSNM